MIVSKAQTPVQTTTRHGGDLHALAERAGCRSGEILDFSSNVNPMGPPEWLPRIVAKSIPDVCRYPDPEASGFVRAFARCRGVSPESTIATNGATEALFCIPRAVGALRAVIPVPSYIDYSRAAWLAGLETVSPIMNAEDCFRLDIGDLAAGLRSGDLVFLGQPNNPTGSLAERESFLTMATEARSVTFVVDESFADFVRGYESIVASIPANVIILFSLTKLYAIPGLRLGGAIAHPDLAARLREHVPPWTVNAFAQAVGEAACADTGYSSRSRAFVTDLKQALVHELSFQIGVTVFPGEANFLLLRLDVPGLRARDIADRLLTQNRIAIRVCDNFPGLDDRYIRIAVRTARENGRLCRALKTEIEAVR